MDEQHKKKGSSSAPKHTSPKVVLNQLALGATRAQVAKSANVSRAAITQMLKRYGIDSKLIDSFKENRADIFAGIQETVAASLTEDDIKKATLRDRTILLGTLYDKERLERGQSTNNTSVFFHVVGEAPDLPGDAMPVDNSDTMSICSGAAPVDKLSS